VLNARILWTFSAAYNANPDPRYLEIANRAYQYIMDHFLDPNHGGVYWSVNHLGDKLDDKKQVYASAFTIYAFSEYYKACKHEQVRLKAISLYKLLDSKSFDKENTGYLEAFTKNWHPINDQRLSEKDANEKKTANTHLHVLEAYTSLYRIWPNTGLRDQIQKLLDNFLEHFINAETWHLELFFDEDWTRKSRLISYGHDIEATWLLIEAAKVIADEEKLENLKVIAIDMAEAARKALDTDGGLWYEYNPEKGLVKEKHWWVQAEAMVGFFNAWQITKDKQYLEICLKNWAFVKDRIIDKKNGEWFWGITESSQPMQGEDKVGLWKCPYHNSRACLEIANRIDKEL
jgi:mannobiose 2-epimerase